MDTTKVKLTEVQKEKLGAMKGMKDRASLESQKKMMQKNMREIGGRYPDVYENLSNESVDIELDSSYFGIWDILVFMFIGMAFFKTGILTGEAPAKAYWWLFIIGMGAGLVISYFRMRPIYEYNFNYYNSTKNAVLEYYQVSRLLRSLGVFGLIMLLYKSGWFKWLFALTRPVGQMAFTNYLTQSLICALFFYGIGFGYFGKLQRYEVYLVAVAIWIVQIIWSHIWLRYFRFGPLEWCWRSLTYWKKQPFKK